MGESRVVSGRRSCMDRLPSLPSVDFTSRGPSPFGMRGFVVAPITLDLLISTARPGKCARVSERG
jgi:hypothetical protein